MGIGEKDSFESFCDFVSSGLVWVSAAYNDLKNKVVDAVGDIVCNGSDDCKSLVSAGLDAGLVALGLPPDIPNFNDLSEQGLDYLGKEILEQAGCEGCSDAVKAAKASGLKDKLTGLLEARKNVANTFLDGNTAHRMGIEPFSFFQGSGHWYAPAMSYPARVTVDITRSSDPASNKDYDMFAKYYYLRIEFPAVNDTVGSGAITVPCINDVKVPYHSPLQGDLFKTVVVPLPPLKPGETISLPINLVKSDYWVPGHKEAKDAMGGCTTVTIYDGQITSYSGWDDWWMLYEGAKLSIDASTICAAGTGTPPPLTSDSADNIKIPSSTTEAMQAYDSFIYTGK
jgi:hypothetical protein